MIEFVIACCSIVAFVVVVAVMMPFLVIGGEKFKDAYGRYCNWVHRRFGE